MLDSKLIYLLLSSFLNILYLLHFMKTFRKLFASAALCAMLGLSSCENVLNILPPLDLANESALTSTRGLQTALTGAYSTNGGLADGSLLAGNCITAGEIWADQVVAFNYGFGQQQIRAFGLNFFNDQGRPIWQNGYGIINRVNNVLEALPTVNDAQIAANRDLIRGESLFLRSWMYFELVKYFAQQWSSTADNSHPGVVLRLTPTKGSTGLAQARATVAQTYTQIIADLTEAERLLPAMNPSGRASKGAAAALLARVYFQQNDLTNAAAAATRVISSGIYSLNPGVLDVFQNSSTPEAIFELQSTTQNDASGAVTGNFRQMDNDPPLYVSEVFSATLLGSTTMGDRRRTFVNQRDGATFVTKYDKLVMNVPLLRYSEILLIRAEATATSAASAALADVNAVRRRAGLADLTGLTGDALIAAIRRERGIELAFEGNRFFELKRTRQQIRGRAWNDNQVIFKIPDVEVNSNTLCTQNPD
jgi:hypothetical protein